MINNIVISFLLNDFKIRKSVLFFVLFSIVANINIVASDLYVLIYMTLIIVLTLTFSTSREKIFFITILAIVDITLFYFNASYLAILLYFAFYIVAKYINKLFSKETMRILFILSYSILLFALYIANNILF